MTKPTKPECEKAIRSLASQWASETGVKKGQAEMPSFYDFRSWVRIKGYGNYLEFRSLIGPFEDAERWFDEEMGQAWRN